jgi:hypothetical protein
MAVMLWMSLGSGAFAQIQLTAPQPESLPETRLRQVAEAYQKLTAYSDHGKLQLSYTQSGATGYIKLPVPLSFVRSESLAWDANVTGLLADAGSVTLVNPQLACSPFTTLVASDFLGLVNPAPVQNRWTAAPVDMDYAQLLGLGGPTLLEVLETLMTRADAAGVIRQRSKLLRSWPQQFLHEGRTWWVVEIQPLRKQPSIFVWIEPGTSLVRWMNMPLRPAAGEAGGVGGATLQWMSGSIDVDLVRVREAVAATRQRLLSASQEAPPVPAPPVAVPPPVPPGEAVPPGDVAHIPGGGVPQAPSKTAPPAAGLVPPGSGETPPFIGELPPTALQDPAGALPYVAVSLIIQVPTGQMPPALTPQNSLFRIIICRIFPQSCQPPPSAPPAVLIPAP